MTDSEERQLREALARSERIIDALIERVECATDFRGTDDDGTNFRDTAFSVFETAVAWDNRVKARTADQYRSNTALARALAELGAATADLEAVNAKLQREVKERAAAEVALMEAKLLAERLNADKTRFLAAVSHDLIQPLNAARLFVTALGHQRIPAPSRSLVVQAGSALDSVEEILEALLEIAQLDAGAIAPSIESLHLDALLASLRTEYQPFADQRGLRLEMETDGSWVASDARLLRRILQNLISNALRYTAVGGVRIAARRQGERVKLTVSDTGVGIAREHRLLIFKEFSRLGGRGGASGAGLGLAIVDRAARMLGHRLSLRSRPGYGSTFSIVLPAAAAQPAQPAAAAGATRHSLEGCRVLAIDNERSSQDALVALLSQWNCRTEVARDEAGAMAILAAGDFCPDIVIADYHLDEGHTGDALIARVRGHVEPPPAGIIVTADRDPRLKDDLAAQGLHLLSKPIKPMRLRALLQFLAAPEGRGS